MLEHVRRKQSSRKLGAASGYESIAADAEEPTELHQKFDEFVEALAHHSGSLSREELASKLVGLLGSPLEPYASQSLAVSHPEVAAAIAAQKVTPFPGAERAKLHATRGLFTGKLHVGTECTAVDQWHPSWQAVAGTYVYIHNAFRNHLDYIIHLHSSDKLQQALDQLDTWLEILSLHVKVEDDFFMPALTARGFIVPDFITDGVWRSK